MELILQKVKNNLDNLKIKNKSLLLAFSGGKDSSALLSILLNIRKNYNLKVALIYLNHNLRTDSANEEKFINNIAKKYNLKLHKIKINKKYWKTLKSESVEMAARRSRYKYFNKILKQYKYDYIITAHNFNDKIETFFINIFRASGIDTLKSIQFKNKNILRPLINVTRNEINEYLKKNEILHYEDYTNNENIYKRNIIRNKLILVFKELHNNYQKSFMHVFNYFDEEYKFIKKMAILKLKKMLFYKTNGILSIKYEDYKKTNVILQKAILKIILSYLKLLNILNQKLIYNLTGKKEIYLYYKKNFICTGRKNFIWFINKSLISNKKFIYFIKKIPAKIKFNEIIINAEHTQSTDFNNFFIFTFNKKSLPIKLRSLKVQDSIYQNDNKKKMIILILKELKIPKILFDRVIVIETKQHEIIGFIFDKIFRVSQKFYIDQKSKKTLIRIEKTFKKNIDN